MHDGEQTRHESMPGSQVYLNNTFLHSFHTDLIDIKLGIELFELFCVDLLRPAMLDFAHLHEQNTSKVCLKILMFFCSNDSLAVQSHRIVLELHKASKLVKGTISIWYSFL